MKKLLIFLGLALASVSEPSLQAMQPSAPDFSSSDSGNTALCIAGACVVTAALYKLGSYAYRSFGEWRENQIVERAADALFFALTFNGTIDQMPEPEKTAKFCQKAQLVELRRNVLKKVESKLGTLPVSHQQALRNQFLTPVNGLFLFVDEFRSEEIGKYSVLIAAIKGLAKVMKINLAKFLIKNPCEGQAARSIWANTVEDAMVESILLKYKPKPTLAEQAKLKQLDERRKKIVARLLDKRRAWLAAKRANGPLATLAARVEESAFKAIPEEDKMRAALLMPNV